MFDDGALAISLPAAELGALKLEGSVLRADALAGLSLSRPLARAVRLVTAAAAAAGAETFFVARPEIFVSPESLAWLNARLMGAGAHLALSDGSTVKLLPGFENHVFFFGLGRRADRAALVRLRGWAPELLLSLVSQVNTALDFGPGSPEPVAIEGLSEARPPARWLPMSGGEPVGDAVRRALASEPPPHPPAGLPEIAYVALDEASLHDFAFVRALAADISRACFGRGRPLVLRLPETAGDSEAIEDRLAATLAALREAGARLPFAPASGAFFVAGDATAAELPAPADLVVPASFDFWRAPPSAYRGFRSLSVRGEAFGPDFVDLVRALTGLDPRLSASADEAAA